MEETYTCSYCDGVIDEENMRVFDGMTMCEECFEERTILCSNCGERIWVDDNEGTDDIPLCDNCFDYYYNVCEDCGRLIHINDTCYIDGSDVPYCNSCYDRKVDTTYIHDYGYKPDPIFYGTGERFLGVELEIDIGGHDEYNAELIEETANFKQELIYIKHDGSLDDGMEIVTHPMTLEFHQNSMPWEQVMQKAIHLGYKSHKTSTCGLHVHINRSSFGPDEYKQEECISRVLFFVERFWQELLRFSRRNENQIRRWAARYGIKDDPKAILDHAKKSYSGRYTCVNLTNYHTIEFRIFRGTLRYNTLIATLQLVNKVCDVAVSMSDEDLTSLSWPEFVAMIEENTSPELISYLKERRLYVNEPVEVTEEV